MKTPEYNRLKNETSPYLQQHAENPVDWYPWCDEALKKAKAEEKLMIVSIGYSACHWCHVMERESFEDEEVAGVMNERFVNIKVDREERPDVDNVYMDAVHLMGQQGGWPLNCICLPDGRPVFGGTYFRKDDWMSILNQLANIYAEDQSKVLEYAENLQAGMKQQNLVFVSEDAEEFSKADINTMVKSWSESFDLSNGGDQGAPKFPMPVTLLFLLRYYFSTRDVSIRDYLELTLDKMAAGGIYDHLGGGFARYSTDSGWKVPHFEKMLYDNAQLVSVYAEGYKLFRKKRYKAIVYETLAFIERELKHPDGGYCAALDADTEGEEGKFYVWSYEEIQEILGDEADIFCEFFNARKAGNWEGMNVLHISQNLEEIIEQSTIMDVSKVEAVLERSKQALFEHRSKRTAPACDIKRITSWNALCLSAFASAYSAFGDKVFVDRAYSLIDYFKLSGILGADSVNRMIRNDNTQVNGFLDDYALLTKALIDMHQAVFDEDLLLEAKRIAGLAVNHFFDSESDFFLYAAKNGEQLFSDKFELSDNVIPSSNSVMAFALHQLGIIFHIDKWTELSQQMSGRVSEAMLKNGRFFSNWAILATAIIFSWPEVVITGEESAELGKSVNQEFGYFLIAVSERDSKLPLFDNRYVRGKTPVYICKNNTCKLPVYNLEEALDLIHETTK